jgi:DNA-binding PadR family transcriptional regulator
MYVCQTTIIMSKNKSFLSGTLTTIILSLLKRNGKMYGYEICQSAKEETNNIIQLTEGAIYPALHKLEKKGIVVSSKEQVNGRIRKYYAISISHADTAQNEIDSLYDFTHIIQALLKPTV